MTEETRNVLLVNTGRCVLADSKEGYRLIEVTSEQFDAGKLPNDGEPWIFGKRITKHLGRTPGMVFEVDVTAATAKLATAQYKGLWPDEEHRARWDIEHRALGQKFKLEAQKKKDERLSAFECRLNPIRDAYRHARGLQRSLMLAHVVRYITS